MILSNPLLRGKLFSLRVPQPFIDKIEKGNPQDPLFLQVMCSDLEFVQAEGFSTDPLEEKNANAVPNILHKYQIACSLWRRAVVR